MTTTPAPAAAAVAAICPKRRRGMGVSGGRTPTERSTGTASTASASASTTASSPARAVTACSPLQSTSAPADMSPARGATARARTTCAATATLLAAHAAVPSRRFLYGISFSCRNQQYGCNAFLLHDQMRAHEQSCHHEPCFCPVPRCGFAGQTYELESHLATLHRWDVVKFRYGESFEVPVHKPAVFCCEDYGELFHIVSSREGYGTALSMICIRPDNACKEEFMYELKIPAGGRHWRLQMQSTVWNTSLRYGIGEGSDVFLLVPDKLPGNESDKLRA